jgi:PIN domain nuclease of toxin-antitoxin system
VLISHVSLWEIAIKRRIGRLDFPGVVSAAIAANGFAPLPISIEDAEWTEALPTFHHDPFDRIMIAQSQRLGMALVTADAEIRRYDAPILWARP